jgi:hypothetical protein
LLLAALLLPTASAGDQKSVELLASAARTADTTFDCYMCAESGGPGAIYILKVTAVTDTPSIVFKVHMLDSAGAVVGNALITGTAVTTTGTTRYALGTSLDNITLDVSEVSEIPVPASYRVWLDHADTDSITYSLIVQYMDLP